MLPSPASPAAVRVSSMSAQGLSLCELIRTSAMYSPLLRRSTLPHSTGPSPSDWPFGRDRRRHSPVTIRSLLFRLRSRVPCPDPTPGTASAGTSLTLISAPTAGWLQAGLPVARPFVCELFQPYLPLGRYQVSLSYLTLFPTVSPAHTLVRRGGCLRPDSAGSTIPRLWPTGSSAGIAPVDYDPPQAFRTPPRGGRPALQKVVDGGSRSAYSCPGFRHRASLVGHLPRNWPFCRQNNMINQHDG